MKNQKDIPLKRESNNIQVSFLQVASLKLGLFLLFLTVITKSAWAAELIRIDGSSTVYPVTEAVAEEFQMKHRKARITVGISGTGGGFKKFCRGETDITDASRPIKAKESKLCAERGINYVELPIAYDGLAVVVNKKNSWLSAITVKELKKLWEPAAQGKVTRWNQIRPEWPNKEIHLFGPGIDSGTFDYFTETVVGKSQASRGDFTSSENDNILVQGITTDRYALGYFGLAYYEENKKRLKLVGVDKGDGPIAPSHETVERGMYYLVRPLFIYVSVISLHRPAIQQFVSFYLKEGPALAQEVGYIALPKSLAKMVVQRFKGKKLGSLYDGEGSKGKSLSTLLAAAKD